MESNDRRQWCWIEIILEVCHGAVLLHLICSQSHGVLSTGVVKFSKVVLKVWRININHALQWLWFHADYDTSMVVNFLQTLRTICERWNIRRWWCSKDFQRFSSIKNPLWESHWEMKHPPVSVGKRFCWWSRDFEESGRFIKRPLLERNLRCTNRD